MLRSTDSAFCFVRKNKSAPVKDKLQFHCRGNNAGRTKKPKAKRAYAWSHLDGKHDQRTRFVAVLEIPPVESAESAVRVQIVKDHKTKGKMSC